MSTTFTTPSSASTSIYKDALLRLDPISPSTWPEWLEALPYCVGGISGVAGVEFYLEGDLSKPPYDRTTMAAVLADSSRAAEYTRWTKVAEVLKASVKLYSGAEAAARVDGLETKYGDAPNIWASLKEWYGHLETGAERGVLYADISNERWGEADKSPAVYFQRLATKVARYNAAAKADALLSPDQSDPNVLADLNAAISSSQQRDLISLYLPSSYAETLSPNIRRSTSLDELKTMINNLYLERISRDQVADFEAARRVVPERQVATTTRSSPVSRRGEGGGGRGNGRGGKGGRTRRGGQPKIPATRYTNHQQWRGGLFTDSKKTVRFLIPRGTCFACFKEGHLVGNCPDKDDDEKSAKSRVEELKKDGIDVPLSDANALVIVDLANEGRPPLEEPVMQALATFALEGLDNLSAGFTAVEEEVNPTLETFVTHVSPSHIVPPSCPISPPSSRPASPFSPFSFLPSSPSALSTTATSTSYILDSGATRHFTTDRSHLHDYRPFATPRSVRGAFGSAGSALGEGTLRLSGNGKEVELANAMLVPDLGVNLLSQTRLMLDGYRFSNTRHELTVAHEDGTEILKLPVQASIRVEASRILPFPYSPPPAAALSAQADAVSLLHRRLGHLSCERMKQLGERSSGLKKVEAVLQNGSSIPCDTCAEAKATRKPVGREAEHPAQRPLEIVSGDTWGPAPVGGTKGQRFALGMVDHYSRYVWVTPMAGKSGVADQVVSRLGREERTTNSKVGSFQSDNGTEFINKTLSSFLSSRQIRHRRTVPYVHGQNGMIERRWRTLLETTRALLFHSRLPLSFWPYALSTSAYLYNRSPSSALPNSITPFESYHSKPPNLSNLRVWGCSAFILIHPDFPKRTHKLSVRAVKARFLGYPEDEKGWLFWVPEWRKIVVAWDVDWREEELDETRTAEEMEGSEGWWEDMLERADEADRAENEEEGGGDGEDRSPPDAQAEGRQEELSQGEGRQEVEEQQPPPQPSPPQPPSEPRTSRRLANLAPTHFVPLAGAPPSPPETANPAPPPGTPSPSADEISLS
ncbi:hypothetical protein JCM11641_001995, partial [Rhodosporidiobolus odoratus]